MNISAISRTRGFSLLELLLALGMFAAMAAMSLPVIRYLQQQSLSVRNQAQTVESQRAALLWLRQALRRAEPRALAVDSASGRDVLWQADARSIRWRGSLPDSLRIPGSVVQALTLEPQESGLALVYRIHTADPTGTSEEITQENVLLKDLQRAEFAYRRFEAGSRLADWQTEWPDATQMPVQVRIRLWPTQAQYPLELQISLPQSAALQIASIHAGAMP